MSDHGPLTPIDGNLQSVNGDLAPLDPLSDSNSKPVPAFSQESHQHRLLHSKLLKQGQSGKQTGTYVSPSDDIMSPASAKLNAFKEKRFAKTAKPRTLFARTTSTTAEASDSGLESRMLGTDRDEDEMRSEENSKMSEG